MKTNPLSLELKIACEIYWCNKHDIQCLTQRLIVFFKRMGYNKAQITKSIDTLFDWSIIRCKQDEDLDARIYFITMETKPIIKDLYRKYWKKERKTNSKIANKNIK